MNLFLHLLDLVYRWLVQLYPPRFRAEFGDEMGIVFKQVCDLAAGAGSWTLVQVTLREVKNMPLAVLQEHLRERKELQNMGDFSEETHEKLAPAWAVTAIIAAFSLPGVLSLIQLPVFLQVLMAVVVFLLVLLPLGIGINRRLPRWSLVYVGVFMGAAAIFVVFNLMQSLMEPFILNWMNRVLAPRTLLSRLLWQWINQARFWLCILVAFLGLLTLTALMPAFRSFVQRVRQDWTLASFLFYGACLTIFVIDFDEYRYEELYQLGCLVSLAIGAWGYLRAASPGWRTLALLVGITACMALMGVGKYFLVPLQDWPYWFQNHSAEQERWFESLRTSATWFWMALFIGLPGLLQSLRARNKTGPVLVEAEI